MSGESVAADRFGQAGIAGGGIERLMKFVVERDNFGVTLVARYPLVVTGQSCEPPQQRVGRRERKTQRGLALQALAQLVEFFDLNQGVVTHLHAAIRSSNHKA